MTIEERGGSDFQAKSEMGWWLQIWHECRRRSLVRAVECIRLDRLDFRLKYVRDDRRTQDAERRANPNIQIGGTSYELENYGNLPRVGPLSREIQAGILPIRHVMLAYEVT